MNCQQTQAALPLKIIGELDDERSPLLEAHLLECAECRAREAELKQLAAELRSEPGLTDIEMLQLENRVLRGVAERTLYTRGPLKPSAAVLLRVAAGVILFAAGYLVNPVLRPAPGSAPLTKQESKRPPLDPARWSGHRVSAEGLRIIARGMSNMGSEPN